MLLVKIAIKIILLILRKVILVMIKLNLIQSDDDGKDDYDDDVAN